MHNVLTPLTRVSLSKHYTTKTTTKYLLLYIIVYPRERDITNIFIPNTEIKGNNRLYPIYTLTETPILTEWNLHIFMVCALRMLGKIVFVIVLRISGSGHSMVYSILGTQAIHNMYHNKAFHTGLQCNCMYNFIQIFFSRRFTQITFY